MGLRHILVCVTFVTGCYTQMGVVRARAAHDLGCTEEDVQVARIAGTTYEAWCPAASNVKATYTCGEAQQRGSCIREK